MSSAGFLMAANFFIAQCFCFFFLAVSARSRNRVAARWFAGNFAVASLSIPFEFLLANFPPARLWTVLAFASILGGAFLLRVGIGHLYDVRTNRKHLGVLFSVFVAFNYVIYDLPRGTLTHALAYQAPLAVSVAMSAWVVWRASARAFSDKMLVGLLVLTSVHFPLKAAIAVHAGSGSIASDYLSSRFALYSQSIGAVLIVTIGLVLLCVLVLEIMEDEKANAEVDVLSGVLNRRGFDNRVDALMAQHGPHSIVICDLDRFKSVNDTYGHQGGDAVIRAFGEMLKAAAPEGALVARIGGEEFAIFLPRTSREAASLFAHVLRATRSVSSVPGLPSGVRVTASFGVAEIGQNEPLRLAMRRADDALYAAKNAGRDCVREAEPAAVVLEVVKRAN
ncbi:GGDEF domain-containing protein [Shinella sp. CPCC 101442]|uniref:GGDEF domain-containing protein n=1 Tax=Shinella sp. CPCC 101442 TaxID=2932265 RepID=UPI0021520469|nr:GGDEF domain-containing protein [Shinella sp. CPCC 101442]MCR6499562.1 GGDEF domain-containing protein [Shinella sp. CPCC 101442]